MLEMGPWGHKYSYYTVVSALAHAPREPRKACAIAKRALKRTFYIVKIDLVIASQRAVMRTVR